MSQYGFCEQLLTVATADCFLAFYFISLRQIIIIFFFFLPICSSSVQCGMVHRHGVVTHGFVLAGQLVELVNSRIFVEFKRTNKQGKAVAAPRPKCGHHAITSGL